jgi:hypothetical protein
VWFGVDDYDILHLKLDEKKLLYNYKTLMLKFENDNKIFEKYKDCFILLDETLNSILGKKNECLSIPIFIDINDEEVEISKSLDRYSIIDIISKYNQDLASEINKMNFDPQEANRFWGESCGPTWTLPTGESYQTCCYYVFWINTGCNVEVAN